MTRCVPRPAERVQVERQGGDERLAFAGLHLGDLAAMQNHPADQLDVIVAEADGALGGLADQGKGLREDLLQSVLLGSLALLFVRSGPHGSADTLT